MKRLQNIIAYGTEFFARYPAVLSGYIIYSYLFVSILRLFIKVKYYGGTYSDVYDIFSALPFMWLLSVSLVKVIDYRSKLHDSETRRRKSEEELQTKATQLETMHEVVLGLQHEVNNPLAIITLSIGQAKKYGLDNPRAPKLAESINDAVQRITKVLKKLSETEHYEVGHIHPAVGGMAIVPREQSPDAGAERGRGGLLVPSNGNNPKSEK
jgi:signal transduction histidine kinase